MWFESAPSDGSIAYAIAALQTYYKLRKFFFAECFSFSQSVTYSFCSEFVYLGVLYPIVISKRISWVFSEVLAVS